MTSNTGENAAAGEGGSSVWAGGEGEEEEGNPRAAVRHGSSEDQCDEAVESDPESIFGRFVKTTRLLNGAAQDNGGSGRSAASPPSQEEEAAAADRNLTGNCVETDKAPRSGENNKENGVSEGATTTEAVIATNGHSFSSSATMPHNHGPTPRDDSGDSTVSSSTASSSSSSAYDACHDNNNFQPSTTSPDYMNLALKQWSVYLGNVLLNFIHKECKGDNGCNVQQHQQQQPAQQPQDHNQASTSAAAATAGYCPCCHYHNQMAQQQQQQQQPQEQQQPQQTQQTPLPPTPPQPTSQSPQTPPPPLHQGYYNYAANFSPFFSAAAAAAALASSSSSSDHSQHFPHNNRIAASSPLFRGRGGCHYVRTNEQRVVGLARIHSAELLSSLISHTKLVKRVSQPALFCRPPARFGV